MSDILIKNMEMPKTGDLVVCISSDGTVTVPYIYTLHFETPVPQTDAIELPPHGRLIDADMLFQTYDGFSEDYYERLREIRDTIINAPTVVEAST